MTVDSSWLSRVNVVARSCKCKNSGPLCLFCSWLTLPRAMATTEAQEKALSLMVRLPLDNAGKVLLHLATANDSNQPEFLNACKEITWPIGTRDETKGGLWPGLEALRRFAMRPDFLWREKVASIAKIARLDEDERENCDAALLVLCLADSRFVTELTMRTAVARGLLETVKYLVTEGGIDPTSLHNFAIMEACKAGYVAIVKFLLDLPPERGVDPAANNNRAFLGAVRNRRSDVVKLLLDLPPERGVDPAMEDNLAFVTAVQTNSKDIVGLLLALPLDRGVDPTARGNIALQMASRAGFGSIVELLLRSSENEASR